MKIEYLVYKKGFEGSWYLYQDYRKDDGYDVFFNLNTITVRKDGVIVMQGGAQNFYYEIREYKKDDF